MHVVRTMLLLLGGLSACTATQPARLSGPTVRLAPDSTLQRSASTRMDWRADGTILVQDRPFFPMGFYHISWAQGGTTAQRLQDLQRLSQAGFNLMLTEPIDDRDLSEYGHLLDAAKHNGIYVMSYGLKAATIAQVGRHPALLGYKIADDSNNLTTPAELKRRQQEFKALSPDKLTYISLSVGFGRPETPYFGVSDLVANQSYPVGSDNINVTYQVMRSTVTSALARHSVPLANLQTFPWTARLHLPQSNCAT